MGMPSPQFVNYENHKGGNTSLADLKGKYVYIDVWATWCGPCKREIPFLKEVEKKYHGKNIEFVSTSIDVAKDYNTWVEMVKNEQLGGIQLMADNNWKSKFVTDYAIEGIPRFILVDPNGNIVTADAPRPSDPKLVQMFNDLKI
jgi:thiol-disulfide isomerase/thioredoxin